MNRTPSSEAKLNKLLECTLDADFQIVAPALLILKNVPLRKPQVKSWLGLLQAPDVATRASRLALSATALRQLESTLDLLGLEAPERM